jgi:hypothetical protein
VLGLVDELGSAGFLDDDRFRVDVGGGPPRLHGQRVRSPRFAGVLYPGRSGGAAGELGSRAAGPGRGAWSRVSEVIGVLLPLPADRGRVADAGRHRPCAGLPDPRSRSISSCSSAPIITRAACPSPHRQVTTARRSGLSQTSIAGRALERRLPWIRREEMRHREAISLELAAVTLRHVYGDACPPAAGAVRPDGPGAGARRDPDRRVPGDDGTCPRGQARAVVDLGRAQPRGAGLRAPAARGRGRAALAERDLGCIDSLCAGRPEQLTQRCLENDELLGRPSGAATLSTLARLLPVGYRAELVEYLTVHPPGPTRAGSAWSACASMRRPDDVDDDRRRRPRASGRRRGRDGRRARRRLLGGDRQRGLLIGGALGRDAVDQGDDARASDHRIDPRNAGRGAGCPRSGSASPTASSRASRETRGSGWPSPA